MVDWYVSYYKKTTRTWRKRFSKSVDSRQEACPGVRLAWRYARRNSAEIDSVLKHLQVSDIPDGSRFPYG